MSTGTSVKIKTSARQSDRDIKRALNLNQTALDAAKPTKPAKKSRFWPIAALILVFIILILVGWLIFVRQNTFSKYEKFIPKQTKAALILKTNELNQAASLLLPDIKENSMFWRWLEGRIQRFLSDSELSASHDIMPLLSDEVIFLILPASTENKTPWALLTEIKQTNDLQRERILNKIQEGLKRDFGTNQLYYRQTLIESVFSFSQLNRPYYWTQINGFVIVGNDLDGIQMMIDKVIDK